MAQFERYIGIDYSGAETPDSSCDGLRCTWPRGSGEPIQVQPPSSPRLYWARRGLAEWLCKELAANTPTIIGIDHGFSFPSNTSRSTAFQEIGRTSCSIFRSIGRPTNRTSTSTSSGTATSDAARSGWVRPLGSA